MPNPDLALAAPTDATGMALQRLNWPTSQVGANVYAQYWIADPAAVSGMAASNASMVETR